MDIDYRELCEIEIDRALFRQFNRYQEVRRCWRKIDGEWRVMEVSFNEQWNSGDYFRLIYSLKTTLRSGGTVIGAFMDGRLVGFASVENTLVGKGNTYLELSQCHVTYESRGGGIGRRLFELSCRSALSKGACKLYISAHSSVETQAFYKAMGCVEAEEYDDALAGREPRDVQLECALS